MTEFFEDSVIRGSATRVQQWGPGNVALQGGLDTRTVAMGAPVTKVLVMGPMTEGPGDRGPGDRGWGWEKVGFLCTSLLTKTRPDTRLPKSRARD